jgi:hypothetical protein
MARMIRKQLYIEPWQDELLKKRSRELGVTEAELMRRGIAQVLSDVDEREQRRQEAWNDIMAFIEKLKKIDAPQKDRDWTREEIYEERLSRYSR